MPSSNLFYSQGADNDLFQLVKQDDLKAFEELYTRYWCTLVNAAYKRLNSKEKAEDIVQNIFVDIYRRRTSINLTISIKAYLYQALKFKVLNEFRSETNSSKYIRHLFFSSPCKTDLADSLEAKELEAKIKRIFNGLPKKCREVFRLSRQEELSNKEIAASLHVTISTVEKHISKALKTLGQQI
jgi:RNA polymerase sigma-70 factor (family 1)